MYVLVYIILLLKRVDHLIDNNIIFFECRNNNLIALKLKFYNLSLDIH